MSAVPLKDVKPSLSIDRAVNDAELQQVLDAAESVIAKHVGPLEPTTVTIRVDATGTALVLPDTQVLSLTSITGPNGTAPVTVDGLVVTGGLVTYPSRGRFSPGTYVVTYQAGYPTGQLPADLRLAVVELTRHLWQTRRGPTARGATDTAGAAYTLPFRVTQLLAAYEMPVFA